MANPKTNHTLLNECAGCHVRKFATFPMCQRCIVKERAKGKMENLPYRTGYRAGQFNLHNKLIERISGWGIESSNREAPVLRRVMEIIDEEYKEASESKAAQVKE
jgi:hypothetical protein